MKHPWALGRPAREVWSEFWDDVLHPLLMRVVERGFPEETYFDISYVLYLGCEGSAGPRYSMKFEPKVG